MAFVIIIVVIAVLLTLLNRAVKLFLIGSSRTRAREAPIVLNSDDEPRVCFHVAISNEPPAVVLKTLASLESLDYTNYNVLVVDNNTADEALWRPVEVFCNGRPRFTFYHVPRLAGFKAGALNYALDRTPADVELISIVDADTLVTRAFLRQTVPHFGDPNLCLVSTPLADSPPTTRLAQWMTVVYRVFLVIYMPAGNGDGCSPCIGAMCVLRRSALEAVGRWNGAYLTEDMELSQRLFAHGYKSRFIHKSFGHCQLPPTLADVKKQHARWAFGNAQILVRAPRSAFSRRPPLLYFAYPAFHFNVHLILFVVAVAVTKALSPPSEAARHWLGLLMLAVLFIELIGDAFLMYVTAKREGQSALFWKGFLAWNALLLSNSLASLAACCQRTRPFNITKKDEVGHASRGITLVEVCFLLWALAAGLFRYSNDPLSWTALVIFLLCGTIFLVPAGPGEAPIKEA